MRTVECFTTFFSFDVDFGIICLFGMCKWRNKEAIDSCVKMIALSLSKIVLYCCRNIIVEEAFKVQLQQRILGDGELLHISMDIVNIFAWSFFYKWLDLMFHFAEITKTFVEESVAMKSHSKAVILVCTFLNSYLH